MAVDEDLESLVKEFRANPAAERVDLEFKSKGILNSRGQKKKLVRTISGMANSGGGTVIVGTRIQDGGLLLQNFPPMRNPVKNLRILLKNTQILLSLDCGVLIWRSVSGTAF
jgi:hypothetical protein